MKNMVFGVAAAIMAISASAPAYAAKVHVDYTPKTIFTENFENGFGQFTKAPGSNVRVLQGSAYTTGGNNFTGTGPALTNHYASFGAGNGSPTAGSILAATIDAASTGLTRYTLSFAAGTIGSSAAQYLSVAVTNAAGDVFSQSISLTGSTNLNDALKNYTFKFDAAGPLSLSFFGGGAQGDGADTLIDNVTVTAGAVPEMGTWGMMIVGFGAIGGTIRSRRRREKAAASDALAAA